MYIKEDIELNKLENITRMNSPTDAVHEVVLGPKTYLKVYVWRYYCPSDLPLEADLEMEKKIKVVTEANNAVILGDFNYFHIDWVNLL